MTQEVPPLTAVLSSLAAVQLCLRTRNKSSCKSRLQHRWMKGKDGHLPVLLTLCASSWWLLPLTLALPLAALECWSTFPRAAPGVCPRPADSSSWLHARCTTCWPSSPMCWASRAASCFASCKSCSAWHCAAAA